LWTNAEERSAESFYTYTVVACLNYFALTHIDYQDQLLLMIKQII